MQVLNFIFVYGVAGYLLSMVFKYLWKGQLGNGLSYLLGFGLAPLLVSLEQYYFYWVWPHQPWYVYSVLTYSSAFVLWAIGRHLRGAQPMASPRVPLQLLWTAVRQLSLISKLLLVFLLATVSFVFVRGQLYPTIWDDAILYFQQGHVYAADRSLDRLVYGVPFYLDGSDYVPNPVIRPAIPVLYSFFYTDTTTLATNDIFIFSGSFLYFYYFVLTLILFGYILKHLQVSNDRIFIGLTLLVSSYYLINFLIYGFKEIILIFFLLLNLWLIHQSLHNPKQAVWPVVLGVTLALGVYINLSGVIIGGILGLIYVANMLWRRWSIKRILGYLLIIGVGLLLTGSELKHDLRFILNVNPPATVVPGADHDKNQMNELVGYRIIDAPTTSTLSNATRSRYQAAQTEEIAPLSAAELKLQLLIKGKLQGITQIQFYGLIFLCFFALALVRARHPFKLSNVEKMIIAFMTIFFVVIMDPLFLNDHQDAYVLTISPKYTILLIPLAALFITLNYHLIEQLLVKLKAKYLLVFLAGVILLVSPIRHWLAVQSLNLLDNFVPLYNTHDYYIQKLSQLYLLVGMVSLVIAALAIYLVRIKSSVAQQLAFINLLFVGFLFIFPFAFLLNSNYSLSATTQTIFSDQQEKFEHMQTSSETLGYLKTIHYLNQYTNQDTQVLSLYPTQLMYYINDFHRFAPVPVLSSDPTVIPYVDLTNVTYVVVKTVDVTAYQFSVPVKLDQVFGAIAVLTTEL